MPGINVAALTEGDLRRLLKVAHARADGLLADRLEWEIAARASSVVRPAGPFATLTDDPDEAAEQLAAYDARPFAPEHAARHPVSGRSSGALLVSLGAVAGSLLSATVFWGIERLPTLDGAQPHPTRAMSLRTAPLVQPPPAPEQAVAHLAPPPAPEEAVAHIAPPPAPAPALAVAQIAPEALPPLPKPVAVDTPAPKPPPPPVLVAKQVEPTRPVVVKAASKAPVEPSRPAAVKTPAEPSQPAVVKTQVAAKKAPAKKELAHKTEPAEKQQAELKTGSPSRPPTLAEWLAKSEPTARQQ
jgi:hypothetical protein